MLIELHGKGGTLCQPAKIGHQHCPLIVRPTSEDNITDHLVHTFKLLNPRHWLSDFLNAALGFDCYPRQVYRRCRIEPWVNKQPLPRKLIPWKEGGTQVDTQITWENPPTTVLVECKYGSPLSSQTNQNDGSFGFPSDQLIRNIRVGLHECGYYRDNTLFESTPRNLAVILLAPEIGNPLVKRYRNIEALKAAIPNSEMITWPLVPFVGEIGYTDIRRILLARRQFTTRAERSAIDALLEYLTYKHRTRPNRTGLQMAPEPNEES